MRHQQNILQACEPYRPVLCKCLRGITTRLPHPYQFPYTAPDSPSKPHALPLYINIPTPDKARTRIILELQPRTMSPFLFPIIHTFLSLLLARAQGTTAESCRPGSFFNATGCVLCPPGFYSDTFGATQCTPCSRGTFNPNAGAQGADLCLPCPPGFSNRADGRAQCSPCQPGTGSRLRAAFCRTCPPGLRLKPVTSRCAECDGMSIATEPNTAICTRCPNSQASDSSGTMCEPCGPGQELVRKSSFGGPWTCRLCKANSVNDGSLESCMECPQGMAGNGDRTRCVPCKAGTARINLLLGCPRCPEGENVGVRGSSLCLPPSTPCPSNYFQTSGGGCISCNRGQRFDPDSLSCVECGDNEESDGGVSTVCKPCGVLQMRSSDGCVCRPGHEPVNGKECRPCPAGFVPDRKGKCELCSVGSVAPQSGSTECMECPQGSVSSQDRTRCDECDAGEKFVMSVILRTRIFDARDVNQLLNLDGTFKRPSGICVDPLTNCPLGSVRIPGRSFPPLCRQTSCPASTIPIEFPPNDQTPETTFDCRTCTSATSFYDSSAGFCRFCPSGSFALEPDATSCTACDPNLTVQVRALGDGAMQARCGCVGKYVFRRGECRRCPRRRIAEPVAWGDATRCLFCPPGTGDRAGTRDVMTCRICEPGFFSSPDSTCERCPSGFTSGFGSSDCVEIGSL